jgi:hypothetical protein
MEQLRPGSTFGFSCHQWFLHESASFEDLMAEVGRTCALDLFIPDTPGGRRSVGAGLA